MYYNYITKRHLYSKSVYIILYDTYNSQRKSVFFLIVESLVFVVVPLTVRSWIFENGFLQNAHKPRFR